MPKVAKERANFINIPLPEKGKLYRLINPMTSGGIDPSQKLRLTTRSHGMVHFPGGVIFLIVDAYHETMTKTISLGEMKEHAVHRKSYFVLEFLVGENLIKGAEIDFDEWDRRFRRVGS